QLIAPFASINTAPETDRFVFRQAPKSESVYASVQSPQPCPPYAIPHSSVLRRYWKPKHIDVKHHLVRDASDARKVIRVAYVRSEDQHADLLTKPLDMQQFYEHAKFILNVV
ncbi:unnamed protein product, partial [Ascophyllum nodosum]